MTDRLSKKRRSWLMSRIPGKDTTPEIALRKALHAIGIRGWRVHAKDLPGKPDLVFRLYRVAIFVDGAFWHGHPYKFSPGRLPEWWERKILANQARDRRVDGELRALGWRVLRIWDIDVRKRLLAQAVKVLHALSARGYRPRATATARGRSADRRTSSPRGARVDSASRARPRRRRSVPSRARRAR